MVLFVLGLVGCIYWATLKAALLPAVRGGGAVATLAALGIAAYSAVVGLTLWSYLACFAAEPGHVPRGWHPFQDGEASAGGGRCGKRRQTARCTW